MTLQYTTDFVAVVLSFVQQNYLASKHNIFVLFYIRPVIYSLLSPECISAPVAPQWQLLITSANNARQKLCNVAGRARPGHRRIVVGCETRVRHGLHIALGLSTQIISGPMPAG